MRVRVLRLEIRIDKRALMMSQSRSIFVSTPTHFSTRERFDDYYRKTLTIPESESRNESVCSLPTS